MNTVASFQPLVLPSARVLILGSMPGAMSLQRQQYYAHPRNGFWPIMSRICGFDASALYEKRVEALTQSGVALWDVLGSCVRSGSLDSSIEKHDRVHNEFAEFFDAYPGITLVCFNGAEAKRSYDSAVLPTLGARKLRYVRLPSTSPAHAVPFQQKLGVWKAELGPLLGNRLERNTVYKPAL
jgi:TDG/mug DNA glycosylase family protein